MWILLVLWIIFFVDGETINECRLVLHAVASAAVQLYVALLHLRYALQHIIKVAWDILFDLYSCRFEEFVSWLNTEEEAFMCILSYFRKPTVRYLEGVCLLLESLLRFLSVLSTLCVGVRHFLQAALFLIVSTARWPQQLLLSKEELEKWQKEQKKHRQELQKRIEQVKENPVDQFIGKSGQTNRSTKTFF